MPILLLFLFSCCLSSPTSIDAEDFQIVGSTKDSSHLIRMCESSSLEEIISWIFSNGGVNQKDNSGKTALHVAAQHDRSDVILLLFSSGAMLDLEDNFYHTPLHTAMIGKSTNAVKALLSLGANVALINGSHEPFHAAIHFGNSDIVKAFIEEHTEHLHFVNRDGETALHVAIKRRNVDFVNLLLDSGSSITTGTFDHKAPLDYIEEMIRDAPEDEEMWNEVILKMARMLAYSSIDARPTKRFKPINNK